MSFSEKLIATYFTKTVKTGQIHVTFASGRQEIYGDVVYYFGFDEILKRKHV